MMKALGAFVFAGSASIGVMNNGVRPDRILELTDGMPEDNAKHFIHNYPDIPVVIPSVWENDEYLEDLKNQGFDLLYGNPPCSGLSLGRRGASADNDVNCHMYRFMDIIDKVEPKVAMFENAPSLISIGKPILNHAIKQLGDKYRFTVIREYGMYHNVAMKRQRTFFIAWRRDVFNKIPLLHMGKTEFKTSVRQVIGDLFDVPVGSMLNHELVPNRPYQSVEHIFPDVPFVEGGHRTVNWVICNDWDKYEPMLNEKTKKSLQTQLYKQNHDLGYWDKSSQRPHPDRQAPSMTGYSSFIHPIHDRQFTIREYARLMGYPDTFEFLPDKDVVRHMAQGVPAKYFEWASSEVLAALRGERPSNQQFEDTLVTFQHHTKEKAFEFNKEEFLEIANLGNAANKEKSFNLEV